MLPVANVMASPIFWFRDIWRFHIIGSGKINIAKSVPILGRLIIVYMSPLFKHLPPGIVVSQLYAKGIHITVDKTHAMTRQITSIPLMANAAYL
jgi:hypothetical protein